MRCVNEVSFSIDGSGAIEMLKHEGQNPILEALMAQGEATIRRASHVLPAHPLKRLAFVWLRRLMGESGAAAKWTRSWGGEWTVDLAPSGGPKAGPFQSRQDAIDYEVAWLEGRQ